MIKITKYILRFVFPSLYPSHIHLHVFEIFLIGNVQIIAIILHRLKLQSDIQA